MFRPATTDDEEFFWLWRREGEEAATVGGWWQHPPTTRQQHCDWFNQRLGRITMLVWYFDDRPAGAVRIDSNGEVAFDAHPLLVDKMLAELKPLAASYNGRLKAVVDRGDRNASKALKDAGFREYPVRFYAYRP